MKDLGDSRQVTGHGGKYEEREARGRRRPPKDAFRSPPPPPTLSLSTQKSRGMRTNDRSEMEESTSTFDTQGGAWNWVALSKKARKKSWQVAEQRGKLFWWR